MSLTHEYSLPVLGEHNQTLRTAGLIAEDSIGFFVRTAPEEQEMSYFDALCEASDRGLVRFRGNLVRLDHFLENGSEIRSVVECVANNEDGTQTVRASSFITRPDGLICFECHPATEIAGRVVSEPSIGSPEVLPGTHQDVLLHYAVAYEGLPVTAKS